ncbi:TPR repeat-containing protein [Nostoc sp. NIES-4103]|nr:TPR repeat-containing protein [Nostoc sp. NIES-4103]
MLKPLSASERGWGEVHRTHVDLARQQYEQGKYQESLETLQQSLILKKNASTLGNIGRVYYKLGQYPQALQYHQQALALARNMREQAQTAIKTSALSAEAEKLFCS